jgi:hypothetical protein
VSDELNPLCPAYYGACAYTLLDPDTGDYGYQYFSGARVSEGVYDPNQAAFERAKVEYDANADAGAEYRQFWRVPPSPSFAAVTDRWAEWCELEEFVPEDQTTSRPGQQGSPPRPYYCSNVYDEGQYIGAILGDDTQRFPDCEDYVGGPSQPLGTGNVDDPAGTVFSPVGYHKTQTLAQAAFAAGDTTKRSCPAVCEIGTKRLGGCCSAAGWQAIEDIDVCMQGNGVFMPSGTHAEERCMANLSLFSATAGAAGTAGGVTP